MNRIAHVDRETKETKIHIKFNLNGTGKYSIKTGIGFFDHMLSLFAVHGFFDLDINATGDIEVDFHHTVEDLGLVLGDALDQALGNRNGIKRFGYAVTPMDEALSSVVIDLSKRPYLVFNIPGNLVRGGNDFISLVKEFLRAFSTRGGMNLHVDVQYGENEHHIIESIFKSAGRALSQAVAFDERIKAVRSTKGTL